MMVKRIYPTVSDKLEFDKVAESPEVRVLSNISEYLKT